MTPLRRPKADSYPLSAEQRRFLARIYSGDLSRYSNRLRAIGFTNRDQVLDLGCGFGQWTLCLAADNRRVCAVDSDYLRVEVARDVCRLNRVSSAHFCVGNIENLGLRAQAFDAIFSYSVIYHADEEATIREISRIVRPGGLVYLNFNSFGWFLYAFLKRGLFNKDLESLSKSVKSILRTLCRVKSGAHAVSTRRIKRLLFLNGFTIRGMGGDGSLVPALPDYQGCPFYPSSVWGVKAVQEILAVRKPS